MCGHYLYFGPFLSVNFLHHYPFLFRNTASITSALVVCIQRFGNDLKLFCKSLIPATDPSFFFFPGSSVQLAALEVSCLLSLIVRLVSAVQMHVFALQMQNNVDFHIRAAHPHTIQLEADSCFTEVAGLRHFLSEH